MSKPKKISTLLRDAAKYIEKYGWTQGEFFKYRNGRTLKYDIFENGLELARAKSCRACLRGALYVADTPGLTRSEREGRHELATEYVERLVDGYPVGWNDDPDRTKEDVVQALKEAAKAARKDGK